MDPHTRRWHELLSEYGVNLWKDVIYDRVVGGMRLYQARQAHYSMAQARVRLEDQAQSLAGVKALYQVTGDAIAMRLVNTTLPIARRSTAVTCAGSRRTTAVVSHVAMLGRVRCLNPRQQPLAR